jgi:hypothetical protein
MSAHIETGRFPTQNDKFGQEISLNISFNLSTSRTSRFKLTCCGQYSG